ncbi:ABC transporter substrate-binding protein [Actinoalloteichus hymeniacidonis]|uniref:ABC-type sugar transport system, periplasmic component n=1 Tax=Actinoalloteichus hymeniacidonis TaxID=340345 RepID=A0AAC9MY86_9PSEU|nr:sugar ABC transporter substrate-binding protein [Actinoalloteichus hymeniacidonis]AOS63045.1 ABC-type sugar transport system, periplasmic component [Actinoalloteichus hymeniacidonis]MBB5908920.1 multiple sugar transport system substrate-binding protein [Actinoalloteichus hymeniacidonis]
MLRRSLVGIVGAVAVLAAGCSSSAGEDDQVTLRFGYWGNDDRAEATNEAIALFEERNPNITVEASIASFESYFQKLATETAGRNAPDVIQMDYRYLREYGDRGALADLSSPEIAAELGTDGIAEELLSSGRLGDQLLGVPMSQNTQILFYDTELFEEAGVSPEDGWTWDDFAAATEAVSALDEGQMFGTADFGMAIDWFEVWLAQQGGELYTADGQLGYGAEEVAEYWDLADSFRESGAATPAEIGTGADGSIATSPMGKNRAASEFGYDSGLVSYTQTLGEQIGLAPFPSDGDQLGQYAKPSMLASVFSGSEHPAEAALFIDFMINDPEAGEILGTTRGMPANDEVRESISGSLEGAELAAYEFEEGIADQLVAAPAPPPPGEGAIKRDFQRINDEVAFGRLSVEEAAEEFIAGAQQQLS